MRQSTIGGEGDGHNLGHERSSLLAGTADGTTSSSRYSSNGNLSSYSSDISDIDDFNTIDGDTENNSKTGWSNQQQHQQQDHQQQPPPQATTKLLSVWTITCILSTAFAYGCIMTTLFLITLPVECERIEKEQQQEQQEEEEELLEVPSSSTTTNTATATVIPKSVALGCFVAIAGVTQLISPLVGMLSDTYRPPYSWHLGQRMPYLCFGSVLSCCGLLGEYVTSFQRLWLRYGFFFFCHMIGLNMTYAMMIALIPDQVPHQQTGTANGILALLLVTGSLSGFGLFHFYFDGQRIQDMYGLYLVIVIGTTILTALYAHDRDAKLLAKRIILRNKNHRRKQQQQQQQQDIGNSQLEGISKSAIVEENGDDRRLDIGDPTTRNKSNDESIVVGDSIILSQRTHARRRRRQKRRRIMLGPFILLRTMIYDPFQTLDRSTLLATYTIDVSKHHDFFIVTVSRLCYYCGSSVQTFFLYFLHDIIGVTDNPESTVAALAVVSQISGALICYPVGWASDTFFGGRRKPFVYVSCIMLGSVTLTMIFARSLHAMTILLFILGLANGSYLTMETSLAVDTLPENYDDGPSGGHAQLLGIWGVAAFLGSALGPMIGGPLLYLVGSPRAKDGQDYSIHGYAVVLGLSTLYFLFSAISLRWVRKKDV